MNTKKQKESVSIEELSMATYFEKDLFDNIKGMYDEEMFSLLKELEDTRYWVAISKYVMERLIVADRSLQILDPMSKQTMIARTQGVLSGLMDLKNMVSELKESAKVAEEKQKQKIEVTSGKENTEENNEMQGY